MPEYDLEALDVGPLICGGPPVPRTLDPTMLALGGQLPSDGPVLLGFLVEDDPGLVSGCAAYVDHGLGDGLGQLGLLFLGPAGVPFNPDDGHGLPPVTDSSAMSSSPPAASAQGPLARHSSAPWKVA